VRHLRLGLRLDRARLLPADREVQGGVDVRNVFLYRVESMSRLIYKKVKKCIRFFPFRQKRLEN
jgi:hypothetical protein